MYINHLLFDPMPGKPKVATEGCELISSENKGIGWANFLGHLPEMTKNQGSASRELIGLHEICTHGSEFPGASEEFRGVYLHNLCLMDNSSPEAVILAMRKAFGKLNAPTPGNLFKKYILRQSPTADDVINNAELDFSPELEVDIRSGIRALGKRKYKDGREEKVFMPHTMPFGVGESTQFFLGLTCKLDELYQEYCQRYDAMWNRATNAKQKLLAEMYFQLIGTLLLHPFWDGNGRTFGAHQVLALNRMGFPVRDEPRVKDICPEIPYGEDFLLTHVNEQFVRRIVEPEFLLTEEEMGRMNYNPRLLHSYMKALHDAIRGPVENGLIETKFRPYILGAYHNMRIWLHRKGYWPYTENDHNLQEILMVPREKDEELRAKEKAGTLDPFQDLDWSQFNI